MSEDTWPYWLTEAWEPKSPETYEEWLDRHMLARMPLRYLSREQYQGERQSLRTVK